jgi:hypothetical protein
MASVSVKQRLIELNDGAMTASELAKILGTKEGYVKKLRKALDLDRPGRGAGRGESNHRYTCGRRISHDGYAYVACPSGRTDKNGRTLHVLEHRLVMETVLGRPLLDKEVVDHIDGLTLHNSPDNLRLFSCNADHLTGKPRYWSLSGVANIGKRSDLGTSLVPVRTYDHLRKHGDVRLRQILLAALQLGIDSPYLLGSHHHLQKKQIFDLSRPNLEREYGLLVQRWVQVLSQ